MAQNQDSRSSKRAGAHISASPNPVLAGVGPGTTLISWSTGDGSWGQVYVSMDGGEEKLFAWGAEGVREAAWIWPSKEYEFRLYAGTERATLLDTVEVTQKVAMYRGDTRTLLQTASTADLHAALESTLSSYFGAQRCIGELKRRPLDYYSSFAIEELDACLDDGTILHLVFKDLSWQGLLKDARRAKPAFLYDPLREIETYQTLLARHRLGTATCYGAVVDPQLGRYWLFLEKVAGVRLNHMGDFAIWQQMARWLATMHTCFAEETESLLAAQVSHLLHYDGDFYRMWLRRAQAFGHRAETSQLGNTQHNLAWLAERYDQVVERLVALPVTFIHGEFYPPNVLVQETAEAPRLCPIDWETAAVGPGLIDLAALTAGKWSEEKKAALALAYYEALTPGDGWPPPQDSFLAALDCCHLHLAMQWLGWSQEWSPAPGHAQNWLSEALRLAEKLGLS